MARGQKVWHPFVDFRNHKLTEWEMVSKCQEFIAHLATQDNCKCVLTQRDLSCNCLKVFSGNLEAQEAVALYMVTFYNKSKTDQQLIIMDWMRYSNNNNDSTNNSKKFFVPFLHPVEVDDEDRTLIDFNSVELEKSLAELSKTRLCRGALGILLDWRRGKWDTCSRHLKKNTTPKHKLFGKRPNNVHAFDESSVHADLDDFFQEMAELGQPQSTRIMREECGIGLREGEKDVVELPPTYSKRNLYYRYCADKGWHVRLRQGSKSDLDIDPIPGFEGGTQQICSWKYFRDIWRKKYSHIKIVSRTADVCTKCHVFRNRLRYVRYEVSTEPGTNSCLSEESMKEYFLEKVQQEQHSNQQQLRRDDADEDAAGRTVKVGRESREAGWEENDIYAPLIVEEEGALRENCKILKEGALHVHRAADQRKLCSRKIKEAYHDYVHDVAHRERRYCLVVDYCQNAALPNLGATQPGETYYMTPLTVAILGIVDCSLQGGSLDAFVYHEGVGSKGGDNVASMIMALLKHKGWLKANEAGGELSILMDNCGGQNKNNCVLRLANLLVEGGFFKKVSFIFYVVGHTKNIADRWFNTMKRDYRNRNLYTFDQLCSALETNKRITIHKVKGFKHYKRFENMLYKDFKSGTIQQGHIFTVDSTAPTVTNILQDCLGTAPVDKQDLARKNKKTEELDRQRIICEAVSDFAMLDDVPPTGIKEIKQIELFEKWRKLVPREFADIICPYPGDDVMRRHKQERNRKARERTQRKRTSNESTNKRLKKTAPAAGE